MPEYEYKCPKCGSVRKERHSIKDNDQRKCEKCDTACFRVIGNVTVAYKCGGFYSTGG